MGGSGSNERRVLVTADLGSDGSEAVREVLAGAATVEDLADLDAQRRARAVAVADSLLAWQPSTELTPDELRSLRPDVLVQLISAGANHVRFGDLSSDAVVAGNVGGFAEPMAEHVLAMVLALTRRLPEGHAALARGEWPTSLQGRSIRGSAWGILGYGGIGREVARVLAPFGVRVLAVNSRGRTEDDVAFVGTLADLDTVLAAADVVVVALPLTVKTRSLIGERELGLMKPDAILVNVARGPIVDQPALFEHLRAHPTFGAAIDVWWDEPHDAGPFRTDRPFFDLPNLLGSPHSSGDAPGIEAASSRRAAENILRFLRGEPVAGVIRREDYPP
jgi:phosphoglycerate dehydrogenase-like enzyme